MPFFSKIQISQIIIGQIEIKKGNETKYTSCALLYQAFSLMPAHVMEDISENDCLFLLKDQHYTTVARKRPSKIMRCSDSELSIIIFDEERWCIDHLKGLQISISEEALARADYEKDSQVRLHGFLIQNKIMNHEPTFQSIRKTICCQYSLLVDNDLSYMSEENLDGFIGAAISMEEQTLIGIHDSEFKDHCFGILFKKDVIEKLVKMVEQEQQKTQALRQSEYNEEFRQSSIIKFDFQKLQILVQEQNYSFDEFYKENYQNYTVNE